MRIILNPLNLQATERDSARYILLIVLANCNSVISHALENPIILKNRSATWLSAVAFKICWNDSINTNLTVLSQVILQAIYLFPSPELHFIPDIYY
jgi:hypothetical protein